MLDDERIQLFLNSFHEASERSYWGRLRKSTNPDRWRDMEIRINEDRSVDLKEVPLEDEDVDLAATHFRKFISGGDEVYLGEVLKAAERLEYQSGSIKEASLIYDQLVDRKWPFRVHDERAVGMYIGETPIEWDPKLDVPLSQCPEEYLSLKDFIEVFFNEGLFHPFVPGRHEKVRSRARTVVRSLRRSYQNVALAGTIYATILLHDAFVSRGLTSCTTANCSELSILQAYWEQ